MALSGIEQRWYAHESPPPALRIASALFHALSALRRFCYRVRLLPTIVLQVPVIVVGNISVGGTGKTPLTLWLAQLLRANRLRPGIVCRSYGGTLHKPHAVAETGDPLLSGDEAVLLAARSRCPVWAAADRVAAARALLEANPLCDILICDDGLQHYRLGRDLEIAVIDAARGFGNGFVLPAGPLREPPSRLAGVDAIVVNRAQASPPLPACAPGTPTFDMRLTGEVFLNVADPNRSVLAPHFNGKTLHAVAGIGNPERFFELLRALELEFTAHAFPDHHRYVARDFDFGACDAILMTEKDAVKCTRFGDDRLWALPVEAIVDDGLEALVLGRLAAE
ncbi:MAG TPA: tetraacyldisaccharide 4'-kinase [Burkholderiales bacterium]|nr:tetraacyldisaccharide 4'-kinase [Burkholderiales bacterium]